MESVELRRPRADARYSSSTRYVRRVSVAGSVYGCATSCRVWVLVVVGVAILSWLDWVPY